MADPTRLKVLKALSSHIENVTAANGYQHDLTGRVSRGRNQFGAREPVPQITILEAVDLERDLAEAGEGLAIKDNWRILIQGWADDDEMNPTDSAYLLAADVQKILARIMIDLEMVNGNRVENPTYMLGGLVSGFRLRPPTVRPPDETSARSYFYMIAEVELAERLSDPYGETQ